VTGLLITFEGPDGAGKTTQIKLLNEALQAGGYGVVLTREPGGTLIGDQIRQVILNPDHKEMAAETEVLLYAAARAQHIRQKIVPALRQGKIVLCDRFVDASLAYQGYGLGVGEEMVRTINQFATGGVMPEITFLLDIPPEEGRKRLEKRARLDRIEQKDLAYHQRVREGFLKLAEREERIMVIDATQEIDVIHRVVLHAVGKLLAAKRITPKASFTEAD